MEANEECSCRLVLTKAQMREIVTSHVLRFTGEQAALEALVSSGWLKESCRIIS